MIIERIIKHRFRFTRANKTLITRSDLIVMSDRKNHDLYDFMRQLSAKNGSEYCRIQKRATEDPGTAGDQGEENWAELLRGWLPRNYEVVTKGRIISQDGITSP